MSVPPAGRCCCFVACGSVGGSCSSCSSCSFSCSCGGTLSRSRFCSSSARVTARAHDCSSGCCRTSLASSAARALPDTLAETLAAAPGPCCGLGQRIPRPSAPFTANDCPARCLFFAIHPVDAYPQLREGELPPPARPQSAGRLLLCLCAVRRGGQDHRGSPYASIRRTSRSARRSAAAAARAARFTPRLSPSASGAASAASACGAGQACGAHSAVAAAPAEVLPYPPLKPLPEASSRPPILASASSSCACSLPSRDTCGSLRQPVTVDPTCLPNLARCRSQTQARRNLRPGKPGEPTTSHHHARCPAQHCSTARSLAGASSSPCRPCTCSSPVMGGRVSSRNSPSMLTATALGSAKRGCGSYVKKGLGEGSEAKSEVCTARQA